MSSVSGREHSSGHPPGSACSISDQRHGECSSDGNPVRGESAASHQVVHADQEHGESRRLAEDPLRSPFRWLARREGRPCLPAISLLRLPPNSQRSEGDCLASRWWTETIEWPAREACPRVLIPLGEWSSHYMETLIRPSIDDCDLADTGRRALSIIINHFSNAYYPGITDPRSMGSSVRNAIIYVLDVLSQVYPTQLEALGSSFRYVPMWLRLHHHYAQPNITWDIYAWADLYHLCFEMDSTNAYRSLNLIHHQAFMDFVLLIRFIWKTWLIENPRAVEVANPFYPSRIPWQAAFGRWTASVPMTAQEVANDPFGKFY